MRLRINKSGVRGAVAVSEAQLPEIVFPSAGKWDVEGEDGARGTCTVTKRADGQHRASKVKWLVAPADGDESTPEVRELAAVVARLRDELVEAQDAFSKAMAVADREAAKAAEELAGLRADIVALQRAAEAAADDGSAD